MHSEQFDRYKNQNNIRHFHDSKKKNIFVLQIFFIISEFIITIQNQGTITVKLKIK